MSTAPTCYAYDPATGLYLGPLAADPSPLEPGVWLYPGSTCLDAPPDPAKGLATVRQGAAWALVPDHRGETWWDAHGTPVIVSIVGDPATTGLSATAPAPPPPTVPDVISDRQCFQQAAILGKVTQDEALAAVTVGALPKAVADGIAALPADQQFGARMLLCGATEFHRLHPMTPTFLAMIGLMAADRDGFWTAAAAL